MGGMVPVNEIALFAEAPEGFPINEFLMHRKHAVEESNRGQNAAIGEEGEKTIEHIFMNIGISRGDEKMLRRKARELIIELIRVINRFGHVVFFHKNRLS